MSKAVQVPYRDPHIVYSALSSRAGLFVSPSWVANTCRDGVKQVVPNTHLPQRAPRITVSLSIAGAQSLRMSGSYAHTRPSPTWSSTWELLVYWREACSSWFVLCTWPLVSGWNLGSQYGAELFPHLRGKVRATVWHDAAGAHHQSLAGPSPVRMALWVIKWACLEKWSTVVRIIMLPAERGRAVMKSRDMWVQYCQRNPAGMELEALLWTHTWQADTYSRSSFLREGHQNKHCRKIIMQSKSG